MDIQFLLLKIFGITFLPFKWSFSFMNWCYMIIKCLFHINVAFKFSLSWIAVLSNLRTFWCPKLESQRLHFKSFFFFMNHCNVSSQMLLLTEFYLAKVTFEWPFSIVRWWWQYDQLVWICWQAWYCIFQKYPMNSKLHLSKRFLSLQICIQRMSSSI